MTVVIGHRAIGVKETRLEDFQEALDIGLQMIEFDLRMTSDRELVVYHGPPGMEGKNIIRNRTFTDLKEKLLFPPPLFREVIDLCQGKMRFDIEIKEDDILKEVLRLLGKEDGHLISSFLDPVVAEVRKAGKEAGLILGQSGAGWKQRLSEIFPSSRKGRCRADMLIASWNIYQVASFQKCFKRCIVWGAPEDKTSKLLRKNKAGGIITDYPKYALSLQRNLPTETAQYCAQ